MSVPAVRQEPGQQIAPAGARTFAIGAQPQLWLNMGYRDPKRKGAPVKTDHFGLRASDEFAGERAKFFDVFGEKPREVDVMLMPRLDESLEIAYKVFVGGGDSKGRLAAWGQQNFALTGAPGRDVLKVTSNQSGELVEVPIAAEDDPFAAAKVKAHLGDKAEIQLYMTFKFWLPKVLGVGGVAAISSRGWRSFRNLWSTLYQWYSIFDPREIVQLQPVLFLREASSPYWDEKLRKWVTSNFYALDIKSRETMEETLQRVRERNALLAGSAPALSGGAVDPGADPERAGGAASEPPSGGPAAGQPPEEPEPVADADVSVEEADGQQTLAGVTPSREQFGQLNTILGELRLGRRELVLEDTGEVFAADDQGLKRFCRAFCRSRFGVDARGDEQLAGKLTAEQLQQLIDHLDQQTVPF